MELNKELLVENLKKIPEVDEEMRSRSDMLRRLLLVIAGDMRVIDGMSLLDLEEIFAMSTLLLGMYTETLDFSFEQSRLVNYAGFRRAV